MNRTHSRFDIASKHAALLQPELADVDQAPTAALAGLPAISGRKSLHYLGYDRVRTLGLSAAQRLTVLLLATVVTTDGFAWYVHHYFSLGHCGTAPMPTPSMTLSAISRRASDGANALELVSLSLFLIWPLRMAGWLRWICLTFCLFGAIQLAISSTRGGVVSWSSWSLGQHFPQIVSLVLDVGTEVIQQYGAALILFGMLIARREASFSPGLGLSIYWGLMIWCSCKVLPDSLDFGGLRKMLPDSLHALNRVDHVAASLTAVGDAIVSPFADLIDIALALSAGLALLFAGLRKHLLPTLLRVRISTEIIAILLIAGVAVVRQIANASGSGDLGFAGFEFLQRSAEELAKLAPYAACLIVLGAPAPTRVEINAA